MVIGGTGSVCSPLVVYNTVINISEMGTELTHLEGDPHTSTHTRTCTTIVWRKETIILKLK